MTPVTEAVAIDAVAAAFVAEVKLRGQCALGAMDAERIGAETSMMLRERFGDDRELRAIYRYLDQPTYIHRALWAISGWVGR